MGKGRLEETYPMSDLERLNKLRDFARDACLKYPTLMKELDSLETHEIRQAFFRDHPNKSPHRNTTGPTQLELPFVQEVDQKVE